MGEKTEIAWCDSAATGRRLGGYKNGARRAGVDLAAWIANHNSGMAWCFRCREWKSREDFASDRSRNVGVQKLCRCCASIAASACRYGMSRDDLIEFRKQACAICDRAEPIVVDHCHKSGKIRDGLCQRCNSAIGLFGDDPALILKALAYLEKHNGRTD